MFFIIQLHNGNVSIIRMTKSCGRWKHCCNGIIFLKNYMFFHIALGDGEEPSRLGKSSGLVLTSEAPLQSYVGRLIVS